MRHQFTPRVEINSNLKEMIGRIAVSNCFPSLRGRLLYIYNEKCYFEILKNPEYPKFDCCEGNLEYLPEEMVRSMRFED
jgi:hypothetical protein